MAPVCDREFPVNRPAVTSFHRKTHSVCAGGKREICLLDFKLKYKSSCYTLSFARCHRKTKSNIKCAGELC